MKKVLDQTVSTEEEIETGKIYCANCSNCKLVSTPAEVSGQYYLRVRCAAGKWKKKLGEEKLYKYCTVSRRSIDFCDAYEDMGDTQDDSVEFMKDLRKTLPVKDEAY